MPRESFMGKVDAWLASSHAGKAAGTDMRTFPEEAAATIQRLVAIAREYASDLRQRGFAFEVVDHSLDIEVSLAGRSGNWWLFLGEHSDAPQQLAFVTGIPPYTRELDPKFWHPSELTDAVFEEKLEAFIARVMQEELQHP